MEPQPEISSKQWRMYLECAALLPADVQADARGGVTTVSFWLPLLTSGPIHSDVPSSLAPPLLVPSPLGVGGGGVVLVCFFPSTVQYPCKGKWAESFIHHLRLPVETFFYFCFSTGQWLDVWINMLCTLWNGRYSSNALFMGFWYGARFAETKQKLRSLTFQWKLWVKGLVQFLDGRLLFDIARVLHRLSLWLSRVFWCSASQSQPFLQGSTATLTVTFTDHSIDGSIFAS